MNAKLFEALELLEKEKGIPKSYMIEKLEAANHGKVHAEYFVDASLLGGAIVEMDGKIMDGSLRRRLRDVKEVMNV